MNERLDFYSGNECHILRREVEFGSLDKTITEYCIANGMNAGRWTSQFGPHCLADSVDCKLILTAQAEFNALTVEVVNISIEVME